MNSTVIFCISFLLKENNLSFTILKYTKCNYLYLIHLLKGAYLYLFLNVSSFKFLELFMTHIKIFLDNYNFNTFKGLLNLD